MEVFEMKENMDDTSTSSLLSGKSRTVTANRKCLEGGDCFLSTKIKCAMFFTSSLSCLATLGLSIYVVIQLSDMQTELRLSRGESELVKFKQLVIDQQTSSLENLVNLTNGLSSNRGNQSSTNRPQKLTAIAMLLSDLVEDQVNYHNASISDHVYQTIEDLQLDIFSELRNISENLNKTASISRSLYLNTTENLIIKLSQMLQNTSDAILQQYKNQVEASRSNINDLDGHSGTTAMKPISIDQLALTSSYQSTTTAPTAPTCDTNYILNPISTTCIRLIASGRDWSGAQSNCESMGDKLAVFTTESAVDWIREFIRNHPTDSDWRDDCQWIGLRYRSGGWYWTGRDTNAFNRSLWYTGEPEENHQQSCGCICMYVNAREKILDCPCMMTQLYSICERPIKVQ